MCYFVVELYTNFQMTEVISCYELIFVIKLILLIVVWEVTRMVLHNMNKLRFWIKHRKVIAYENAHVRARIFACVCIFCFFSFVYAHINLNEMNMNIMVFWCVNFAKFILFSKYRNCRMKSAHCWNFGIWSLKHFQISKIKWLQYQRPVPVCRQHHRWLQGKRIKN